jgi:hypothetical protein
MKATLRKFGYGRILALLGGLILIMDEASGHYLSHTMVILLIVMLGAEFFLDGLDKLGVIDKNGPRRSSTRGDQQEGR